jgi:hypothetical protein
MAFDGARATLRNQLAAPARDRSWTSWQRARQAGVLSPNDVRTEEIWLRRAIRPPTASSRQRQAANRRAMSGDDAKPPTPPDDGDKNRATRPPSRPPCLTCLISMRRSSRRSRSGWRAYLDHKADVGAPHATDEAIVERTDEVTALMLGAMARAIAERRHTGLLHYSWFVNLINELLDALPGKPLDG